MKKGYIFFFSALYFLFASKAVAAAPVPDTGQTACYDNTTVIECPAPGAPFSGQDAQYQTGTRSHTKLDGSGDDLPDTASSWAMVRDNVTGLIWECKTDDGSVHDKDNTYESGEASLLIDALNTMEFGGFDDWRLPDVKELSSLTNRRICISTLSPF